MREARKLFKNVLHRDRFLILILIAISIYLFIFKLGESSLWNMDEPIYGEVAKEVLKLGDWITLHFNYQPWFDKPPLYTWLTAITFRIFGCSEFTTRIWSALFGIGGVIAVYFLGKNIFNKRAGFLSGLILATNLQYIIQSRLALLDVPLSFFISLSILFFYLGDKIPNKRWYYLLSFIFMALATLTKGPIGILLPALIIGLYLLLTGKFRQIKRMMLFRGIIIYLGIASPWYIIELIRYGDTFINNFFLQRTIARFLTPFEGHTGPVYYFIPVLFLGFFPWSSFLPCSFVHLISFRKWRNNEEREKSLLILLWFSVVFLFFSSAKSKLPGYILPLYPAASLSVGKLWDDFLSQKGKHHNKGMIASFALFFILLIILFFVIILIARPTFPVEYELFGQDIILMIIGLIIGGGISFSAFFYKKPALSLGMMIGTMCFLIWILTGQVLPKTEFFKPTKFLANKLTSVLQPGERIGDYPSSEKKFMTFNPSLIYYSNSPVVGIEDEDHLIIFLSSEKRVYCLMSEKNYNKVKGKLQKIPVHILDRKGGEVLLSNRE